MKILKNIVTIFLSFVLMIGILCSTVLFIANKYLDKKYILNKFEEINLYGSVYEEVRDGFENYIYQSGLDINIIDKICSKEKVKSDIISVVDSMYSNQEVKIDSSQIRNNLDNAIDEYVKDQGRKLSKQEKENIEKFEDLIENSYKEKIGIYQKGSNKISGQLPQILSLIKKIEIYSIVGTSLILIILVIINSKKITVAGSFCGVSIFSSGMIMIISNYIIKSKISIDNLVLFTKSLSATIINILNSVLNNIKFIGIGYVICGILIILFMNFLSLKDKKI